MLGAIERVGDPDVSVNNSTYIVKPPMNHEALVTFQRDYSRPGRHSWHGAAAKKLGSSPPDYIVGDMDQGIMSKRLKRTCINMRYYSYR
jgi:hypothetical protein